MWDASCLERESSCPLEHVLIQFLTLVLTLVLILVLIFQRFQLSSSASAVISTMAFAAASFAYHSHHQVDVLEGVLIEPKGALVVLHSQRGEIRILKCRLTNGPAAWSDDGTVALNRHFALILRF